MMDIGKLGVWYFLETMPSNDAARFLQGLEKQGYPAFWLPEAVGREAFAQSAWLLARTEQIVVATGIANIWARDPMTMAAGQKTLAEASGGRFLLGIGVSHAPLVEGLRGHAYRKPLSTMRDYLDKMQLAPFMAVGPTEAPPTIIGAIRPKMIELAGERTLGTHTYFVPEHTARTRAALGPDKWICVAQAVILESDADRARAVARNYMRTYVPALPNYTENLRSLGWTDADFADGCSDRLVDAIVAWGDEKAIVARIKAHLDAGASHVCFLPLRPDGMPLPDERVLEALAGVRF